MAPALDVIVYLLVFAVILVMLIRLATKARSAQTGASGSTVMETENPHEHMLLRFLEDEKGTRIGETVALEEGAFIVKDARGFLAVPVDRVREEGKGLRLTGPFDEASARAKGDAWRTRSHKVITYAESELPKDDPEG